MDPSLFEPLKLYSSLKKVGMMVAYICGDVDALMLQN